MQKETRNFINYVKNTEGNIFGKFLTAIYAITETENSNKLLLEFRETLKKEYKEFRYTPFKDATIIINAIIKFEEGYTTLLQLVEEENVNSLSSLRKKLMKALKPSSNDNKEEAKNSLLKNIVKKLKELNNDQLLKIAKELGI